MKSQDDLLEEYTKINLQLNNALDVLTLLDKERDKIIALAESDMTNAVQEKMEENLIEYERLSQYIVKLKMKAEELKK